MPCFFEKKRLNTRLNGENLIVFSSDFEKYKDNSVQSQIQPRKQPGIYMIRCKKNDWRYYGESKNVSGRLASHRSMLNRQIHPNKRLQLD